MLAQPAGPRDRRRSRVGNRGAVGGPGTCYGNLPKRPRASGSAPSRIAVEEPLRLFTELSQPNPLGVTGGA